MQLNNKRFSEDPNQIGHNNQQTISYDNQGKQDPRQPKFFNKKNGKGANHPNYNQMASIGYDEDIQSVKTA